MTNVAHKNLTGVDLHEPKGIGSATSGQVYVANGSNSGTWTTLSTNSQVLIKTQNVISASSIDFVNGVSSTVFDGTYKRYILDFFLNPSVADTCIGWRAGTGGGPTYQTGGVYSYTLNYNTFNNAISSVGSSSATFGSLTYPTTGSGLGPTTSAQVAGRFYISDPSNTSVPFTVWGETTYYYSGVNLAHTTSSSVYQTTGTALTALRCFVCSGTGVLTGRVSLYGIVT